MPDISRETHQEERGVLERVGMTSIEMPLWVIEPWSGEKCRQPAKVDAFVSLDDPEVRGIHMSRLYLALQDHLQSDLVSFKLLKKSLEKFIQSQKGISQSASISLRFEWPVQRESLLSGEWGWRQYPIELSACMTQKETAQFFLSAKITYSSTCPCSAALSRQLVQEQFSKDFSQVDSLQVEDVVQWLGKESSIVATPHAQRSHAKFKLELVEDIKEFIEFIDLVEGRLGTPVQTIVKRQDEQEFARLNGGQLMFCEDAARKIQKALEEDDRILDYWVQVEHLESLHPHNAVSIVTKGRLGGLRSNDFTG